MHHVTTPTEHTPLLSNPRITSRPAVPFPVAYEHVVLWQHVTTASCVFDGAGDWAWRSGNVVGAGVTPLCHLL